MKRLARDRSGATAIEYGIIAGMLAVAVVACMAAITPGVGNLFAGVAAAFPSLG